MQRLKNMMYRCKCSVSIAINDHKDSYDSVSNYLEWRKGTDSIEPEILKKMIELDTIVEIQFYPRTPIGFYNIFHYDIDKALDASIGILDSIDKNKEE